MADTTIKLDSAPFVTSVAEVVKSILEYCSKYRDTMSQENRDKYDILVVKSMERWDSICDVFIPVK